MKKTSAVPPQWIKPLDQNGQFVKEWYLFLANVRNNTAASVVMIDDAGIAPVIDLSALAQAQEVLRSDTIPVDLQSLESRVQGLECLPVFQQTTGGESTGLSYPQILSMVSLRV